MPLTSISVCMPKTVFDEEKGFKPNLKLGEDFDLWIRVALKHKVVFSNKPLAYYNQDVDVQNRAVGLKFYKPEEHMLFTDYGDLMNNPDFRFLFERLALYGLLPYYLNNMNCQETAKILNKIDWHKHEKKYRYYYKVLPKYLVKIYFITLRALSKLKKTIKK